MSELPAWLADPALSRLWDGARARLERSHLTPGGRVVLADLQRAERHALASLLARPIVSDRVSIDLAELDQALARRSPYTGLAPTVVAVTGQPLHDRRAERSASAAAREAPLTLARELLTAARPEVGWGEAWLGGMRRSGLLTRADEATAAVRRAVTALTTILPAGRARTSRTDLAASITGDAHGLDDSQLSSAVLLRAAAHALGKPIPESTADRRELWQALGVATDSISGTVLTWRLRPPGPDRWSAMLRERADLGLVTHLTLHELERAGEVAFAEPSQSVSVCENPQVLQAAAHAGANSPLVCLSGNPAAAGTKLLRALIAAGNPVRYHGDFDWPGVAIAGRIIAGGAVHWRMSAADYRGAVAGLDSDHAVALTGKAVATPWDPALASAMATHGLAVHEESLLHDLVTDLAGELGYP